MKTKMNVLFVAIIIILISIKSNGQTNYCLRGGMSLAYFKKIIDDETVKNISDMRIAYHFGGNMDFMVSKSFSIQPGIFLSDKGYTVKTTEFFSNTTYKGAVHLLYVELPVLFTMKKSLKNSEFYYGAGPYLGIGLSGKVRYKKDSGIDPATFSWGSDETDDFKRLDYGLSFAIGVVMKSNILLGLSYDLGLPNIDSRGSSDYIDRSRAICISLGYLLK